ncbi:hypothetical protein [Rhodococcus sp. NPDC058514]|uniref:hypothetical protein n=1 Tax=unclassified Rhodococcus (in: high G+C Gram-positive bacteria) TaxID=192944 RepID=UPI003646BCF5
MRPFHKVAATAAAAALVSALPIGIATAATPVDLDLGSTASIETTMAEGGGTDVLAKIQSDLLAGLDTGSLEGLLPGGPGTENPGTEPEPELPAGPTVTLSKATGLAAAGETITVSGTRFSGAGSGLYVGLIQDSKYSATDSTAWMTTKWLKPAEIVDGVWTATVDVAAVKGDSDCLKNTCSIYTVAAHGSADRTQDTKTPVTFAG